MDCKAVINHEVRLAEYRESFIFLVFLRPEFFFPRILFLGICSLTCSIKINDHISHPQGSLAKLSVFIYTGLYIEQMMMFKRAGIQIKDIKKNKVLFFS